MQWVIPQTVGKTRGINSVADGTRQLTFTETKTACMSKAYAEKIVTARAAASGIPTQLHDLNFTTKNKDGSIFNNINRAPGDISWVQLLSPSTPWVYNEFGGKVGSNETVELSQTEKEQYATGLASGIREALELRDTFLQKCQ
jgi:hypothetical protein